MSADKKRPPEAWFGAAIAFIAFIFTGAIPGLVYGEHMGHMAGGILFGEPIEPEMLAKFMAGGGMILGVLATFSLYMVLGALTGNLVGAFMRRVTNHPVSDDDEPPVVE
jgi:hypothetical protein